MSKSIQIQFEEEVQKWYDIKLKEVKEYIQLMDSSAERLDYIKSYKKSINNLFYRPTTDFKQQYESTPTKGFEKIRGELRKDEHFIELLFILMLDIKGESSNYKKRTSIQKVNYGEILIPETTAGIIRGYYESYIEEGRPIGKQDLNKYELVAAFVYDKLLQTTDDIYMSSKLKKELELEDYFTNKEILPKLKAKYSSFKPKKLALLYCALEDLDMVSPLAGVKTSNLHSAFNKHFDSVGRTGSFNQILSKILSTRISKHGEYEDEIISFKNTIKELLSK